GGGIKSRAGGGAGRGGGSGGGARRRPRQGVGPPPAEARPMNVKRPPVAGARVVLGLAARTGALAWRSRGWPLIHDAPLMHYIAWRIVEGAVPYRDLFDMNSPGVYLVHVLAFRLFGAGDAGWRAFDLAWLAAAPLAAPGLAATSAKAPALPPPPFL